MPRDLAGRRRRNALPGKGGAPRGGRGGPGKGKGRTKGPIHAVPCPLCDQNNDFREAVEDTPGVKIDALTEGNPSELVKGTHLVCDHCEGIFELENIAPVTIVKLRAPTRAPD